MRSIGRVLDPLGNPLDGQRSCSIGYHSAGRNHRHGCRRTPAGDRADAERASNAIDAMTPIGRGQRELIIGDRKTGKTAIAIDAILNQKGKGR